jgi:hypothetical protein
MEIAWLLVHYSYLCKWLQHHCWYPPPTLLMTLRTIIFKLFIGMYLQRFLLHVLLRHNSDFEPKELWLFQTPHTRCSHKIERIQLLLDEFYWVTLNRKLYLVHSIWHIPTWYCSSTDSCSRSTPQPAVTTTLYVSVVQVWMGWTVQQSKSLSKWDILTRSWMGYHCWHR